uniref:SNF2 N-terminal domain-containing protein n=1 Tax=Panagrolaimus davidi TaxID=227884 RepID=A0A914P3T4_9BILA
MENRQPSKRSHSVAVSNNSAPMNNKKLCIQHTARENTIPSNSTPIIDAANLSKMIETFKQQNHGTLPPEIQNQLKQNPTWNTTGSNNFMDSVHPALFRFLKEHQKEAIKFLFDRVIGKQGAVTARSGAILAHCMGLGKSFTIITFLHAVLSNDVTSKKISRVLIVCPKNVIAHWEKEIKNWIDCPGRRLADNIQISCIHSTSKDTRFYDVKQWSETTDKKQILIVRKKNL